MLKEIIIFVFTLAVCHADTPVSAHAVYCGYMPTNLYSCLGNPRLFSSEIARKCQDSKSMCDRMKCIFNQSGWLKDNKVDKKKMSDYLNTYATEHPAWAAAVTHAKAACLGDRALPTMGVILNCPQYDIMHCALTSFIRNASGAQWGASAECDAAREYAGACPVCPDDCFATQVPNDSCHACHALPRSA